MKKKMLVILIALVMMLSFSGCGPAELYYEAQDVYRVKEMQHEIEKNLKEKSYEVNAKDILEADKYVSEGIEIMYSNKNEALELFEKAALCGNEDGMLLAGYLLDEYNVSHNLEDYVKAKVYYEKAAEDNPFAKYQLGQLYTSHQLGYVDKVNGTKLFKEAEESIDEGSIDGLEYKAAAAQINSERYHLGNGVKKDYEKFLEWAEKSAGELDTVAMLQVADYYMDYETEDYYNRSLGLQKVAVEIGDIRGCVGIGNKYRDGKGVEQDYDKAAEYYQRAVDEGDVFALDKYAGMVWKEEDYTKYFELMSQGERMYDTWGGYKLELGFLYYNGQGTEKDVGKAREYWQKAFDIGNPVVKKKAKKMLRETRYWDIENSN